MMHTFFIGIMVLCLVAIPVFAATPSLPEPTKIVVVATAYSPRPQETDSTPFITATGTRVRDGIIAANFLPFGTLIRIPELFGDKIFTVEDRMNRRYTHAYPHRIDIFFHDTKKAIRFGKQSLTLEVVEMNAALRKAVPAAISLALK